MRRAFLLLTFLDMFGGVGGEVMSSELNLINKVIGLRSYRGRFLCFLCAS